MGFNFRKRFSLGSLLRLNFHHSKRGQNISFTAGRPGLNINIGKKKNRKIGVRRYTVGIPGSGARYDKSIKDHECRSNKSTESGVSFLGVVSYAMKIAVILLFVSSLIYSLTK